MRYAMAMLLFLLSACNQEKDQSRESSVEKSPAPSWIYSVTNDGMRGKKTFWAELAATNHPELEFPYSGGSPLLLQLYKVQGDSYPDNFAPRLVLSNGQYDCASSSRSCYVSVKVDENPVEEVQAVEIDCGSSRCLNIHNDPYGKKSQVSFIETLRSARRVIFEVPLYKFGSYQYEFNTAGLKWSKTTDHQ